MGMLAFSVQLACVCLIVTCLNGVRGQFADWSMLGGRPHEPTCVDIPKSMSLCADIGYDKMRLPNLLGHDTLAEVKQQSGSWVPLLKIKCHPYTKLFMCSLFAPVCLENEIFPCRSLCEQVQRGCEGRINNYGFKWPDMLRCDKFPVDNDMCIKPMKKRNETIETTLDEPCTACSPVETYENVLDNFCRSDFVIKARINHQRKLKLRIQKVQLYKSAKNARSLKKSKLYLDENSSCCSFQTKKQRYLIMGNYGANGNPNPHFIMKWSNSKTLKKAVRMFKGLDCKDPNLFTPDLNDGSILPKHARKMNKKNRKNKRNKKSKLNKRRNRKQKNKRNKKKQRRKEKANKQD